MNTVPARSQSPFGESISAQTFTASDPLHQQFVEAVEVYRPFEVPGELGPLCEQITLPEAVELVEAIMKRDSHEVRCKHRPLFARTWTASTAKSSGPIILQCKDPGRVSCLTCQWHCDCGRDLENRAVLAAHASLA
jgi:hypothetical protein